MNTIKMSQTGYILLERRCRRCSRVKNIKKFKNSGYICVSCQTKGRDSYKIKYKKYGN